MDNLTEIHNELLTALDEYFDKVTLPAGSTFVLGCSTSEVAGQWKGTGSSLAVGREIVKTLHEYLQKKNIFLAIQGCEHINRSLLVERENADRHDWEQVTVVPALHAGGGAQVAGYETFSDPVEVEHITAAGGFDIGGTEIGMHVKFVQIPVRMKQNSIGEAHLVALSSRPKLVGGIRAKYDFTEANTAES